MYSQLRLISKISAVTLGVLALTSLAQGQEQQLTAESVLSSIVENYGPQYEDVEKAITSLRAKDGDAALKHLETAYQKNKDLPPPDTLLAQILFRGRNPNAGRAALDRATAKYPNDPAAYIYLGDVALGEKRQTEASTMYNRGLDLCKKYSANPKRRERLLANAYGGLALMEEQKENWPAAKTLLEQLLKHDAKNAIAKTRLGRVLFKMAKNTEDEKKAYEAAVVAHSKGVAVQSMLLGASKKGSSILDTIADDA